MGIISAQARRAALEKLAQLRKSSPEFLANQRKNAAKGLEIIRTDPEVAKRRAEAVGKAQRGVARTRPGSAADEYHFGAKRYVVIDPNGVVREFINLKHFVRQHPELFNPVDVVWTTRSDPPHYASPTCRAHKGLARLFAVKHTRLTWKGWRGPRDPEFVHYIQALRAHPNPRGELIP